MSAPIVVLKLGGSVLRDPADLSAAVHEVYRHVRRGSRVLAVVSAFQGRTDSLARLAAALGADADPHDVARLLGVGEAESAAALGLALDRAGVPARVLDPRDVGPVCDGDPLDATPRTLDVEAIALAFEDSPVCVLAGWVGRAAQGEPVVLGRGGSDLTALFAAEALDASRCVLLKDVAALYEADPSSPRPDGQPAPRRLARASFDDALRLAEEGSGILQPKAVRFAASHGLPFEVAGAAGETGTRVSAAPTAATRYAVTPRPLRVRLAGLGTVGTRVFDELAARPDLFQVDAILVRDASRPGRPRAAEGLLEDDPEAFFSEAALAETDVFVELCGGVDPAADWIGRALEAGVHVVTANKAALAVHGAALEASARGRGRTLSASAAVGGALPALEAVRRASRRTGGARLVGFEGVLNGTTTFVLDRLHAGVSFAEAVREAQAAGYAEADPTLDLDGTDIAHKVELLARAAGWTAGARPLRWLTREGVAAPDLGRDVYGRVDTDEPQLPERLVGACHLSDVGPLASVVRRTPGPREPLASARGAGNVLVLHRADGGTEVVRGRGAGAWPTATSVLADLFDLARVRVRSARAGAAFEEGGAR